jgi:hypothetical protein
LALRSGRPDLLNGGNEQGEQNSDDGDDDEKLNERESFSHGGSLPPLRALCNMLECRLRQGQDFHE